MSNTNRRRFIGRGAAAAAAVTAATAPAAAQERPTKKIYGRRPTQAGAKPPLFNSVVSYGNLVFIAGVGAHYEGDIKAHTKTVLDQIQKNLELGRLFDGEGPQVQRLSERSERLCGHE